MAVKPLPPDLLEWFRDAVRARTYERIQYDASLSPVTIRRVLETGQASAGVIARIEALRGGQVTRERVRASFLKRLKGYTYGRTI